MIALTAEIIVKAWLIIIIQIQAKA